MDRGLIFCLTRYRAQNQTNKQTAVNCYHLYPDPRYRLRHSQATTGPRNSFFSKVTGSFEVLTCCVTSVYSFAFCYSHGHAHVRTCLTRKNLQHTHVFCVRSIPVLVHVRSGQIQLFTTSLILCPNTAEPHSTLCPYGYTVMNVTLRGSYQQ